MRKFSILAALAAAVFTSACQDGAEIIIEPTQYKTTWADFDAGEICVDSNAAAAPFIIHDRKAKLTYEGVTYECIVLPVGAYSLEFLAIAEYSQTPPPIGDADYTDDEPASPPLELHKGETIEVTGIYAP